MLLQYDLLLLIQIRSWVKLDLWFIRMNQDSRFEWGAGQHQSDPSNKPNAVELSYENLRNRQWHHWSPGSWLLQFTFTTDKMQIGSSTWGLKSMSAPCIFVAKVLLNCGRKVDHNGSTIVMAMPMLWRWKFWVERSSGEFGIFFLTFANFWLDKLQTRHVLC